MTPTVVAIFGLVLWMMFLLVMIAGLRTIVTMSGSKQANSFAPTGEDVSPFSARLCRAHANCYEFVPFALAVLLFAVATDQSAVTDGLAYLLLGARIAQSVIHIISTSVFMVMLRFVAIVVQLALVVFWSTQLITTTL